jgi:hypothetical protein
MPRQNNLNRTISVCNGDLYDFGAAKLLSVPILCLNVVRGVGALVIVSGEAVRNEEKYYVLESDWTKSVGVRRSCALGLDSTLFSDRRQDGRCVAELARMSWKANIRGWEYTLPCGIDTHPSPGANGSSDPVSVIANLGNVFRVGTCRGSSI